MTEGRPHYFTKRDANQADIAEDLRRLGFRVVDTSPLGGKVLDLFVCGYKPSIQDWAWLHVEVKTDEGSLTDGEKAFFEECPQCPAIVAQVTEDVLEWYTGEGEWKR